MAIAQRPKSWIGRLWTAFQTTAKSPQRKIRQSRLARLEQLENRQVFASLLLTVPGIDGNSAAAGASPTDMDLTSFEWSFGRTESGPKASTSDPFAIGDIKFRKAADSTSNDLYLRSNTQPVNRTVPAQLRLLGDTGAELLKFSLSDARLTSYSTHDSGVETGSLNFSRIAMTESLPIPVPPDEPPVPPSRSSSWNLLTNSVVSGSILGPGDIDVGDNTNIETVMQIGSAKIMVNDYSWQATSIGTFDVTNPTIQSASSGNFKITRPIDNATAGLLGRAAAGTNLGTVRFTDRDDVQGQNKVVLEWTLYNAFVSDFGLNIKNSGEMSNDLEFGYSRIDVKVSEYNLDATLKRTITTTWDQALGSVTSATNFGTPDPVLAPSQPAASFLDFGSLGQVQYTDLNWEYMTAENQPVVKPMNVSLLAGSSTPALLGQLARKTVFATIAASERNSNETVERDVWSLNKSAVTSFKVESTGTDDALIELQLSAGNITETYNYVSAGTPTSTSVNYDLATKITTGGQDFGGRAIDTNFELWVTENGLTTKIPLNSASWSGNIDNSIVSADQSFLISTRRGFYSQALFGAATRSTTLDKVQIKRFDSTGAAKQELYRWELSNVIVASLNSSLLPGNSPDEVDEMTLRPNGQLLLVTRDLNTTTNQYVEHRAGWSIFEGRSLPDNQIENFEPPENTSVPFVKLIGRSNTESFIPAPRYDWQAQTAVGTTDSSGNRSIGVPQADPLNFRWSALPSTAYLNIFFTPSELRDVQYGQPKATVRDNLARKLEYSRVVVSSFGYEDTGELNGAITGLGFSVPESIDSSPPPSKLNYEYTPRDNTGSFGTTRSASWDLTTGVTTSNGLGGISYPNTFADPLIPAIVLRIVNGTELSDVRASSYSFGTANPINQPLGNATSPALLTPRGTASASTFTLDTRTDTISPGLLYAIASQTALPELRVIERKFMTVGSDSLWLPFREWILKDVYVEQMTTASNGEQFDGTVTLKLNPGSAQSDSITYNSNGSEVRSSRLLSFIKPPTAGVVGTRTYSSTTVATINLPLLITDVQQASTDLQYSVAIEQGADLFDSVSFDATNKLVMDFKNGFGGLAKLAVSVRNVFGLITTTRFDVGINANAVPDAPAGTDRVVTTNEDTGLTISSSSFGFTDPKDFPPDLFTAVIINTLPALGTLTLSGLPVVANQTINVADITASRLRYQPPANANGDTFSSLTFQVRDSADISGGGANLDPTPNLMTFRVLPVNDAPVITSRTLLTSPANANVVFSSATDNAIVIQDVDAGISPIQVQFTSRSGRFTLSSLTGLTVTTATNGTSDFTVRGALADINAALVGAIFTPNTNFYGTASLRVTVSDLGNTGSGGALTRGQNINMAISPVLAATNLGTLDSGTPSAVTNGLRSAGQAAETLYAFTLTSTNDVRVVLSGLTANANLYVYSATGLLRSQGLQVGTTIENLLVSGLTAGTYVIGIRSSARTPFQLTVSQSPNSDDLIVNPTVLTLAAGTTPTAVSGGVVGGTSNIQDYYRFTTTAAGSVRLNLHGLQDDLDLQLLNSVGAVIATSSLGQTNIEDILVNTLNAGVYHVRVFALPNRALSNYRLTVSLAPTSDDLIKNATSLGILDAFTSPLLIGTGSVGALTDVQDFFSFTLAAPSSVRLNLSGMQSDADVQLLDSFGRVIVSGIRGSTTVEDVQASGLAAGTYYVRIDSVFAGAVYDLSVSAGLASDDLLTGAVALGALSASSPTVQRRDLVDVLFDPRDYYQFSLAAASDVRINLSGMNSDADVFLEDAFGRVIGSSLAGGNTIENLSATGLAAGTYFVRVKAYASSTNYALTVSSSAASDDLITNASLQGTLTASTSPSFRNSGAAGGSDIQDYLKFTLTTPATIRLNLSGLTADLNVEVLDAFGTILSSGVQAGNAIELVNVPSLTAGDYYVRVFATAGAALTNYVLEVTNDLTNDDTILRATNLGTLSTLPLSVTGSVNATSDIQDYYRITLTSTRNVRFLLTGFTVDLDIIILDSLGRRIGASESGGTTAEDVTLSGLTPGNYFVRVFPFNGGSSSYQLSIS